MVTWQEFYLYLALEWQWITFKVAENEQHIYFGPLQCPAVNPPENHCSGGTAESAAYHFPPTVPLFTCLHELQVYCQGAVPSGLALVHISARPRVIGVCQQFLDDEVLNTVDLFTCFRSGLGGIHYHSPEVGVFFSLRLFPFKGLPQQSSFSF